MTGFDPDQISLPKANNFIGGRRVEGRGAAITVRRPSDGRVQADLDSVDADQLAQAVENAQSAYKSSGWAQTDPRGRMKVLRRWADLIEADAATLAPLEALGSTRTINEINGWDLSYAAETIRFFAEWTDKVGGEVAATTPDKLGLTITEPYGVVAAIAPWNLPLVMAGWKIAPAIAAGNSVVLKPSEMTPFSIVRLAELAVEAGLPAGVFNIVQGDGRSVGDPLVRRPEVAKVTFTGSTTTGAAIMAACAQTGPKPVTLELGGKSPQIIFADAGIDKAAAIVARAITLNAGQVCVAGSRLLVQEKVADQVIDRILAAFAAHRAGPTWAVDTTLGPIISEGQLDRIDGIVKRAVVDDAEVLAGGGRATAPQEGSYFAPTLLANVDQRSEVVQGEIFGPVLTVQTFADEDEAYALANDSAYGLAAGVHTGDVARALRATRSLEAGTVWVNRYGRSNDFILPTGGYKQSGIGKDLGREAYMANLKTKTALIEF
ncbi:aldehyde dehydrogenase family protein [Sphingobium sp.]|uniref:aldehyde dehydrogenase family protein n=1 Tax=Sphingobium sp. TaxID=1912891 RepID=UPI002C9B407A|nr:aldehyde dehydrogenase family protein [Sphingobium sp.]HUD91380.1 aldehyde dehydrogenase family protein [Sphingobium sp.]